jgi:hypothetical protein
LKGPSLVGKGAERSCETLLAFWGERDMLDAAVEIRSRAADEPCALGAVDELGDRALGQMHPLG